MPSGMAPASSRPLISSRALTVLCITKKAIAAESVAVDALVEQIVEEVPVEEIVEDVSADSEAVIADVDSKPMRKYRRPFREWLRLIGLGLLAVVAVVGILWMLFNPNKKAMGHYAESDAEGYTLSVRFDANGGYFDENS